MSDEIAVNNPQDKHMMEASAVPLKSFLSEKNRDLQPALERLVADFCSRKTVFLADGRKSFPKYGLSSEMALRTPIRLYDLPALVKVCSTAFTEGSRVFINASFFRKNLPDLIAGKISLDFLLGHELEHIRLLHVDRMKGTDHEVANTAADIRINIDLLETFTATRLLSAAKTENEFATALDNDFAGAYAKTITEHGGQILSIGYGTDAEDRAKWWGATSEQIAKVLAKEKAERPRIDAKDLMRQVAEDMRGVADEMDKNAQNSAGNTPARSEALQGNASPSNASQQDPEAQKHSDQTGNSSPSAKESDGAEPTDSANGKPSQTAGSSGDSSDAGKDSAQNGSPSGDAADGASPQAEAGSSAPDAGETSPGASSSPGASDASGNTSSSPGTPHAEGGPSASDLRAIADAMDRVANGTHSKGDLEKIRDAMEQIAGSDALNAADANHPAPKGLPKKVEDIPPSVRSQMAGEVADQMLNPSAGKRSGQGQSGGGGKGDATDPGNYTSSADRHYIPPEDLNDILNRAGAQNLSKALGCDTPEAIAKNRRDAAKNAENAVRSAAEEIRQSKGSYPGAHRVEHALRDLQDFNRPVLNWKMHIKRVIAQSSSKGRKTHYSIMDPWIGYTVAPSEMGFSSANDVPYMGSHIPAKPKKNLIVAVLDTSGSTSGILLSLASEAINLARKNKYDSTPDVVLLSADTVVRGKPILITEQSLKKMLASGFNAAGMGGTDFLAPLLGIMKGTERGGIFHGKKIDHILYFTDGECWLPPKDKLPANLPPVSFIVPQSHYELSFDQAVKESGWAHVEFFSEHEVKEIDLSRRRGMRM